MVLNYEQTKELIAKAKSANNWSNLQRSLKELGVPEGPQTAATYFESLEKHSTLLDGLKPEEVFHILSFVSKRKLQGSPLMKKLTPSQVEKLTASTGCTLGGISFDDLRLNKITKSKSFDLEDAPRTDQIWEVLPKKWKKAPKGVSVPYNYPYPMKLDAALYPTLNQILADTSFDYDSLPTKEKIEEQIQDLMAAHPDWSERDAVSYLHNRAARYTPEYKILDEKFDALKATR